MAVGAYGRQCEIDFKVTGQTTTVPNDPYIKLAYYLNCVHWTDCPNSIPSRLVQYKSMSADAYRSTDELEEIVSWAEEYSPSRMRASGFFIMVPDGTLNDYNNRFIQFSAHSTQIGLLATNQAALALVQKASASVELMVYEERWEDVNFYNPRRSIQGTNADRSKPRKSKACSVA
jgi:hypothetical protein